MVANISTVKTRKLGQRRGVLTLTNNVSGQALRLSTIFRKLTSDFQAEWGRSCTEACVVATDRRLGFTALAALRTTLEGGNTLVPPETPATE